MSFWSRKINLNHINYLIETRRAVPEMLQQKLEHYIKEIKRKFHLRSIRLTPKIVITKQKNVSIRSRNFGVIIENNVIKLSERLLKSPLLEGILIREAARTFLPEILQNVEEAIDIPMFIAYKLLHKKEEWFKQWEKVAPQKFLGDIRYWPTYDFIEYDKATAGKSIKIFLDLLKEVTKYGERFESEEYIYFFDYSQKEVFTPLSQKDIELIEVLKKNPQISFLELSKKIGRSESMARRIFKKLEQRIWLRIQAFPNWSKINLEHFSVLLRPSDEYREVIREKLVQPYVRKIHVLGGGRTTELLAFYALPVGTDYILDRFLKSMKENGMIHYYLKMLSEKDMRIINFGHYNVKEKGWSIPWMELKARSDIPLQEIEREILTEISELDYKYDPRQFDHTDLKILELVFREEGLKRSIKKLTKDIGIPRARLVNRLDRLREEEIFIPRLVFLPLLCGLSETLLLFVESDNEESLMKIKYTLQLLPLTYMLKVRGDIDGLISFIAIPGQLTDAFRALLAGIVKLPGVSSTRLYFEHQESMIGRFFLADFYDESKIWKHPRELWKLDQLE